MQQLSFKVTVTMLYTEQCLINYLEIVRKILQDFKAPLKVHNGTKNHESNDYLGYFFILECVIFMIANMSN